MTTLIDGQLSLFTSGTDADPYDILVTAGVKPDRARVLVEQWTRWPRTDALLEARRHATKLTAPTCATCPICGAEWNIITPVSWWLTYDRCYACMRIAIGVDHVPSVEQMAPFERSPS